MFSLAWMMVLANFIAALASWGAKRSNDPGHPCSLRSAGADSAAPGVCRRFVERRLFAYFLIMVAVGAVGLALSHFRWPRAPMLIGLVLGALAENRLFLSTDAYGAAWLLRPGVLVIAGVIAASFVYPVVRRQRAPHRADDAQKESPGARADALSPAFAVLLLITVGALVLTASFAGRAALFPRLVLGVTAVLLSSIVICDLVGQAAVASRSPRQPPTVCPSTPSVSRFVLLIWASAYALSCWWPC